MISSGQSVTWEDFFPFNLKKSQHRFWPPQATSPAEQPHAHHCTETHNFTESILKKSRAKKKQHAHTPPQMPHQCIHRKNLYNHCLFNERVYRLCINRWQKPFSPNHWIALLNYFSPQIYIHPHSPPTRPHSNPLSPPLMFLSQPQSTVVR